MNVVVITPPEALLTVEDARKHLRVDTTEEDDYILSLIETAQGAIDGPAGWLGRSIGTQTLELRDPAFSRAVGYERALPFGPVIEVLTDAIPASDGVRYRAGYAPTAGDPPKSTVPKPILHAMKIMVGALYENRGGDVDLTSNPTVASLLSPYRNWRV